LIELLVVIAILSLLLTILMPSLYQARRLAWNAACQVNLKHIALAEHIYAGDWGEYFPGYSWIDANGVAQNDSECFVLDPNGPGGLLSLGQHSNGSPIRVIAFHQNLFVRLGILSGYAWCQDLTNQAILEAEAGAYVWQARPNYNAALYMTCHMGCSTYDSPASSGIVAKRTAVDYYTGSAPQPGSGFCPHLIRTDMVQSEHVLLGERHMQRNNWSVGYGYPAGVKEYSAYQVGFRHPGPAANFALVDGSVHSWDLPTWLDNYQWAAGYTTRVIYAP